MLLHIHGVQKDSAGRGRKERVGCRERVTQKHTLPCIKQILNGNLLYDSGNSNWGSITVQRSGAAAKKSNSTSKERWLSGHRRAKRSYSTFKVRRGSPEEIPLVQGKEQRLHLAGAAVKGYPMTKIRKTQVRWQVLRESIRGQTH